MATGASLVKQYEIADREKRVCLLLENYASFDVRLEIERAILEDRIKEEYLYKRFSGAEELGVRVQTSSHGSPTEVKAIIGMEIEAALKAHDFDSILFKNISGMDEIRRDVYTLELMQMDFSVFQKQVKVLKPIDRKVLERVYMDGMDLESVAKEEYIDYASVRQRVRRARAHIKSNMYIYWDSRNRRAV